VHALPAPWASYCPPIDEQHHYINNNNDFRVKAEVVCSAACLVPIQEKHRKNTGKTYARITPDTLVQSLFFYGSIVFICLGECTKLAGSTPAWHAE